ncbi:MAG TPA: hypothetical protein VK841_11775 [Polyangiaceae bacterium]|jgi:hypothetical protein|nr:hypothetical protein [Polyangiaceae bacterium]
MPMSECIRVSRVLTETPLARQHDRAVSGRTTRQVIDVPWSEFDRSKYPEPALALATKAQTMLATGEYEAVDLFSRISAGLVATGAPIDLVTAATRAATDEIRHCDYAFRMAALSFAPSMTGASPPYRRASAVISSPTFLMGCGPGCSTRRMPPGRSRSARTASRSFATATPP